MTYIRHKSLFTLSNSFHFLDIHRSNLIRKKSCHGAPVKVYFLLLELLLNIY